MIRWSSTWYTGQASLCNSLGIRMGRAQSWTKPKNGCIATSRMDNLHITETKMKLIRFTNNKTKCNYLFNQEVDIYLHLWIKSVPYRRLVPDSL